MKVLTIKQPWATLIMQGDKRFEFRSWQTKYRGDLLIHAGKGIDKENVESRIAAKLETEELKQFKFLKQKFEEIELEKNNLVVANFSLPFCNKNDFKKLWNKIDDSILKDGYFVGNFFGDNDEWKNTKEEMTLIKI